MSLPVVYIWKKAPVIRLLVPLMTGIQLQWHFQFEKNLLLVILVCSLVPQLLFFFLPFFRRFRLLPVNGVFLFILIAAAGAMFTWKKDIRNNPYWFTVRYQPGAKLILTLKEDPVEKTKSYKANASLNKVINNDNSVYSEGTIILYFKKDSIIKNLIYGNQLLIWKPLQEIKNSGNPGGFDYKRYSLFNGITHQVFLKEDEYVVLGELNRNPFRQFINSIRESILSILRKNISGSKELGLAEALLIGYKDDLDKTLVQSYSNTGVVHVIAISGLHLGLIYWLLVRVFKPVRKFKHLRRFHPLFILSGLWLFSILSGAQPSVIRSAVMFSCIVLGESFDRKTSIYNTLAFSATMLLCFNPYWLWDVGFQLSYAAVLSIVVFMRPIYNWFYFRNKLIDFIWKLNAVTLAAQVFTLPVSIYHFHQYPNYFLLTNFIAVPLSSLILLGEIFLCVISFIPDLSMITGKILGWLIWFMNTYIERVEELPFSLNDGIQISIPQAVLLILSAAATGYWLIEKSKYGLRLALISLTMFLILRTYSYTQAGYRKMMIVYNVPQKTAMDFIEGRNYFFDGNQDLLIDDFSRNFHLKPSRILHRTSESAKLDNLLISGNLYNFFDQKILVADSLTDFSHTGEKEKLDLFIVSGNPKLHFSTLARNFEIGQVVFDGTVPYRNARYWKKDCDSLHIPWHDVSEKGAFVMRLR